MLCGGLVKHWGMVEAVELVLALEILDVTVVVAAFELVIALAHATRRQSLRRTSSRRRSACTDAAVRLSMFALCRAVRPP